jgi:hypothetical protein
MSIGPSGELFSLLVYALAVLIVLLVLERLRLRVKGPALVLREFKVSPAEREGELVVVRGRPSGLLGYVLTLLHLQDTASLVVTDKEVRVETASLHGLSAEYVPIAAVASSQCVYFRAFLMLVAAFLIYGTAAFAFLYSFLGSGSDYDRQRELSSLRTPLWAAIVVGTVFYVAYALSKRILISVETDGGRIIGLAFKRSVIENVSIELDQARKAVEMLNGRLLAKREPRNA